MGTRRTTETTGYGFPAGGVFEAALDAVVVMSADGCVTDWNPAAESTFGYSREEAVGRELAGLIIPAELRDRHWDALNRFLETREPAILDQRLELTAIRSSGDPFPVELTVTRVPDVEPPLFAGFVRDLTEQQAAERRRAELEARLAFLAEAGFILEGTLQLHDTLETFARLTVPDLADVCVIDLIEEGGAVARTVAAAHDPAEARAIEEVRRRHPLDLRGAHPVAEALRQRRMILLGEVSDDFLRSIASAPEHLALMQGLRYSSAVVGPLVARGRALGAVSLLRKEGSRAYEATDMAFVQEVSRRAAVAVDNARLYETTEHVARTLQQSLLPTALPDIPGVCVVARYHAAARGQQVGGDFYDVFEISEGTWGFVIGDVCGKGPEAAALTALARHTVRAAALHNPEPSAVLQELDSAARRDQASDGRFLSVVYGTLGLGDGLTIRAAAGGHPAPLILRSTGRVEPLPARGPLIGVHDDPRFATAEADIAVGDALVLYTDGLTDAAAPARTVTESDLVAVLEQQAGRGAEGIASVLEDHATSAAQPRDDIAILVLEATSARGTASASQRYAAGPMPERGPGLALTGAPSNVRAQGLPDAGSVFLLPCTASSTGEARRLASEVAAGLLCDTQQSNLMLAVTEVVSNAIRHSGAAQEVELAMTVKDGYLCVQVTDSGTGLVPRPGSIRPEAGAGFGLFLVEQLTRRWGMTRQHDHTRVWFEIDLRDPDPQDAA